MFLSTAHDVLSCCRIETLWNCEPPARGAGRTLLWRMTRHIFGDPE